MTSHNCFNYTLLTLNSILDYVNWWGILEVNLVCVDNASTDFTPKYLEIFNGKFQDFTKEMKIKGSYTPVLLDKNYGCAKSFNEIFKRSKDSDYVIYINNDIVPSHNWLVNLLAFMKANPKVGVGSSFPVDNTVSDEQKFKWFGNIKDPIWDYEGVDQSWFNYANLIEIEREKETQLGTNGCAIVFSRECIDKVGDFDENFVQGCYEDIDYNVRALRAGFDVRTTLSSVVMHWGGTTQHYVTVNEGGCGYRDINKKYFEKKWNVDLNALNAVCCRSLFWKNEDKPEAERLITI